MGRLIEADEVKKRYPIMENDFGMVINERLHKELDKIPPVEAIYENNMTDEEKENHPEYKTIGGYIKTFVVTDADKQAWWNKLSDTNKQAVYNIPFFDAKKFKLCTGIDVKEQKNE